MDEQELIQKCIHKDKHAWDIFVCRYSRLIYDSIRRTLLKFGVPRQECPVSDIYHDIFVQVLNNDVKALRAFKGKNGCSLAGYLRSICVRKTIDHLRKRRLHVSLEEIMSEQGWVKDRYRDELAVFLDQRRITQQDAVCIVAQIEAHLSEQEKKISGLIFKQGLSPAIIAEQLGLSVANVYVRKQRLLKKIRLIVKQNNELYGVQI